MPGAGAGQRAWGAALLALAVAFAACTSERDVPRLPSSAPPPPTEQPQARERPQAGSESPTAEEPAEPEPFAVELKFAGAASEAEVRSRLEAADRYRIAENGAITISDGALPDGQAYVVETWVAVVPQRHLLFELSMSALRSLLAGEVTDWAAAGGAEQPVTVYWPAGAEGLRRTLGVDAIAAARILPRGELAAAVQSQPGALGLVPVSQLRPGLLPLVVDGHDPLRDPAAAGPLIERRWIAAPTLEEADALAGTLGWGQSDDAVDPLGLLATGDYLPTRCVPAAVETWAGGDYRQMFALSGDLIRQADIAVVSMEVAASDLTETSPCGGSKNRFLLAAPPAAAEALAWAGVDVVTSAGNHAGDCYHGCSSWKDILLDSAARLDALGLAHVGSGADLATARQPAWAQQDGVRVAVLSYDDIAPYYAAQPGAPGVAPLDLATLEEDVRRARARADHVIVAVHWGIEYRANPTPRQQEAAAIARKAGATLVIGNHPHWVQAIDERPDGLIAYALGNFIFDQSWSVATTQSVILEAGLSREGLLGYRLRPVMVRRDFQPEPVPPASDEGRVILRQIWAATDALGTG